MFLLASPALAGGATGKSPAGQTLFKITKLVSDQAGKAKNQDPNLVNAWGMSQLPGGPVWVSDNGTGLSTVYDQGTGVNTGLVVTIPGGTPTGNVYATGGFQISENGKNGNAEFIFATEAGIISGWNSSVDEANAVLAYDGSAKGSVYKGLALDTKNKLLFAADFTNNQVQVFDSNWNVTGSFTDTHLKGYAPFNVAVINGEVYVAFAKQAKKCCDEVDKLGDGYIDVFDESGKLVTHLAAKGELDAPWGMTIAPSTFGTFAGALLVGNFGNGWINAYDAKTGSYLGWLDDTKGAPLAIDGLWGLDPVPNGEVTFAAGPRKESHGLLGLISAKK
ncbi:MAG TPA: TIGR03118 family protein [Rhizomicrobium sp.]